MQPSLSRHPGPATSLFGRCPHLVEQLHEHEDVEDEGVVHGGAFHCRMRRHAKQHVAVRDQAVHDCQLEGALPDDVAPQRRRDERLVVCAGVASTQP